MIDASTQVRVRFVTSNEVYRISDAPFVVPARLGRAGLSEVIHHLLQSSDEDKVAFDFQIGEHLLRSPLFKFFVAHRLSTEDTVTVHYFVATSTEQCGQGDELPAWVSSIDSTLFGSHSAVGCYDGKFLVVDSASLSLSQEIQAHDEPINAVACYSDSTKKLVSTASKDNTIKVWSISDVSSSPRAVATLCGHINSVESVQWSSAERLVSGDWSGHIAIWDVGQVDSGNTPLAHDDSSKKKSKKRRTDVNTVVESTAQSVSPLFSFKAHTQSVSGLHTLNSVGYSSSWDHSVKVWDLERQDNVFTINTSKVVTSLSYCAGKSLIATSHPDGKLRIWDERRKESTGSPVHSLGASSTWTAQVKWMPNTEYSLGSVDYNGCVNLWDLRFHAKPIAAAEAHSGKALCFDWWNEKMLSGGSDCIIKSTAVKM